MDFEEFIQFFTHEVNYNLKLLGVPWKAEYKVADGRETALAVIQGRGHDLPPISINDYYHKFLQGLPWVAAREATQEFFDDKISKYALIDMEVFPPDLVIPTLMNRKESTKMLEAVPYLEFEDLAIVLQATYQSLGGINLDLVITDDILQEWNLGFDELYEISLNNPRNIESVQMIELYKMMGDSPYEKETRDLPPFYIVTNTSQHLGAASILYKVRMRELADIMGDDILLVPMSVDNFLAMPRLDQKGMNYIANALQRSNEEAVGSAKPLSENLYFYNCQTEQYHMIKSNLPKKRGR